MKRLLSSVMFRLWLLAMVCVPAACDDVRGGAATGCEGCSLTLTQVGELGNTYDEPGSIDSYLDLASGPHGRIHAVYNGQNTHVVVHDSTGAVVATIGRRGRGPGEFAAVFALHATADTLFVFDNTGARISFFNHAHEYLGATPLPHPVTDGIPLSGGRFVVNSSSRLAGAPGYPLHIVGADGRTEKAFGFDSLALTQDRSHLLARHLAVDPQNGFWTAPRYDYRLEYWDDDGERRRELRREVEWFPSTTRYPSMHPDTAPAAQFASFQVRPEGIWTLVRVADHRWAEGLEPAVSESGRTVYRVADPDKVFDSIIELLDPGTGEVLAAHRDDRAFNRILADGRLVRVTYDADGRVFIGVWRLDRAPEIR